jgi:hypothetical protein
MQLIKVIEDLFQKPPIPFEPTKHSLKAWATYCLQDRGFKVVYAQDADFAVEAKGKEKVYFKMAEDDSQANNPKFGWIILDRATGQAKVIAPEA